MADRNQLDRIEHELRQQTALLTAILNGDRRMASQLDTIIQTLNDNTNAVSTRLDKLIAQIGDAVTPDQLTQLQAVSDHLRALGADPANPVPAPPPTLAAA